MLGGKANISFSMNTEGPWNRFEQLMLWVAIVEVKADYSLEHVIIHVKKIWCFAGGISHVCHCTSYSKKEWKKSVA